MSAAKSGGGRAAVRRQRREMPALTVLERTPRDHRGHHALRACATLAAHRLASPARGTAASGPLSAAQRPRKSEPQLRKAHFSRDCARALPNEKRSQMFPLCRTPAQAFACDRMGGCARGSSHAIGDSKRRKKNWEYEMKRCAYTTMTSVACGVKTSESTRATQRVNVG